MEVKIAIITPFRDTTPDKARTKQLIEFAKYMNTYLEGLKYTIFLVEQSDDNKLFNRGKLLNIGFDRAKRREQTYLYSTM